MGLLQYEAINAPVNDRVAVGWHGLENLTFAGLVDEGGASGLGHVGKKWPSAGDW